MIDAQVAAEDQTLLEQSVRRLPQHRARLPPELPGRRRPVSAPRRSASSSCACASSARTSSPIPSRQVERKIKEAILALRLDDRYPGVEGKQRILEMYMNQVLLREQRLRDLGCRRRLLRQGPHLGRAGGPADDQRGRDAGRAGARSIARSTRRPEAVQSEVDGETVYVVPRHAQAIVVRDFVLDADARRPTSSPRSSTTRRWRRRSSSPRPADNAVPGAALRLRRAPRGERAARGRGPARHRRAADLHDPRLRGLPGLRGEVGAASATTWTA